MAGNKGKKNPRILIVMGSQSDWETLSHAAKTLEDLKVEYEAQIVSAHRTPDSMSTIAKKLEKDGVKIVIAGAGGAAHLPGMMAALCTLPVLGVPVETGPLRGMDSLLSIVQMPAGVPVGTLAIGKAGAVNAALFAVSILAQSDSDLNHRWKKFRQDQTDAVLRARLKA
jgi:5-(carboxyamino)imidazole ribonucleotide mutase